MDMLDVLAIGEVLIDLVAQGEARSGGWPFTALPGGAPANVAVGAARLGRRAGFLGSFSDDFFGSWLRRLLAAEGVDLSFCPVTSKPTTLAFVGLDAEGERSFSFYRNETSDIWLTPADITEAALAKAKAIHVCSVSLSRSPAREATLCAVQRAKERGLFVSFDVNLRPQLWADLEEARQLIGEVVAAADLVKLSEEELHFLLPGGNLAQLRARFEESGERGRARLWVLTCGRDGAVYVQGDATGAVPAFAVKATDTTGAGDAFVAALLAQLAEQDYTMLEARELPRVVRFAHAAAALCVQRYGAIPALPFRAEVDEFLQAQP